MWLLDEVGRVLAVLAIVLAVGFGLAGCSARPVVPSTIVQVDPDGNCLVMEQRGERAVVYSQMLCDPWKVSSEDSGIDVKY